MSRHVPTFVIDQSALIREGLKRILAGTRYRVIATCADIHEIQKKAARGEESLIILGLDGAQTDQISRLKDFKVEHESAKLVVLGEHCCTEDLVMAVEAGADGFLSKQTTSEALLKSLDIVFMGETIIPSAFLRMIVDRSELSEERYLPLPKPDAAEPFLHDPEPGPISLEHIQRLSCKERLILRCLTQGASNKAIARELNMAEATVKVHIKGILRKIRVRNRTQAAVWALNRAGEAPLEDAI